MSDSSTSHQAALQVTQQAVLALLKWAASPLEVMPAEIRDDQELPAVTRAKQVLSWPSHEPERKIGPLRLLFDEIKLPNGQGKIAEHWCPMAKIDDSSPAIPYPVSTPPTEVDQTDYRKKIRDEVAPLLADNWHNLSLLSLILEKYSSCLSFGEANVALVDLARITGAVAAALAQSFNPDSENQLSLVAGDLSGIQKFIYTISSDGALKSLRARSFYLELATEEVVQQILNILELPRTSIIYAGGGNLYILASAYDVDTQITHLHQKLNRWLRQEFQGKVYLALDYQLYSLEDVSSTAFQDKWNAVIGKLNKQKASKFQDQISDLLKIRVSHQPCKVCHS